MWSSWGLPVGLGKRGGAYGNVVYSVYRKRKGRASSYCSSFYLHSNPRSTYRQAPREQQQPEMTTFTKISDSDTPLIEVDADRKLSKVDPMTYGGFTEYVVRTMGGGGFRLGRVADRGRM